MKNFLLFGFIIFLFFVLNSGSFGVAFAQVSGSGSGSGLPNPLGSTGTIPELLEEIIGFLVVIAAPIAAAMIIYGAFQILFAGGDPEKFKAGKKTILYTVIAYAIILVGWGIASIIEDILGISP